MKTIYKNQYTLSLYILGKSMLRINELNNMKVLVEPCSESEIRFVSLNIYIFCFIFWLHVELLLNFALHFFLLHFFKRLWHYK